MDNQNNSINIVTSLNDKYTIYTVVLFTSILESQTSGNPIHIYVLQDSLSSQNKSILKNLVERYGQAITFLQIDRSLFHKFGVNENWSYEAYFRLLLPDLMPTEIERLLYLDVDVIVNKDLAEMYFMDLEGIDICGAYDVTPLPFTDNRKLFFNEWYQEGTLAYFCSGVTLWNLKAIREHYNFEKYIQIAKNINFMMVAPDQDILNIAHHGRVHIWEEAEKYGLLAKHAYSQGVRYEDVKKYSVVIHYAGQKPWAGQYIHYDIEKLWWDYAKKTPYYVELVEAFMEEAIGNPLVYDTFAKSIEEKELLHKNLQDSLALNQKLIAMIQQ